ncbi:MAG: hypothetical protein Q8K63_02760 [Acidimicrobiales bacterium]|nr:hypothetical protein [Acidimicrobiales bacterium]
MVGSALAVLRRPDLWLTGVRQAFVMLRPGVKDYMHFRMVTQYGGDGGKPTASDLVQYLSWVKSERSRLR